MHPFAEISRILVCGFSYLTLFEWIMIVSLRWDRQQAGHRFVLWNPKRDHQWIMRPKQTPIEF
jgi:hypothetical protein